MIRLQLGCSALAGDISYPRSVQVQELEFPSVAELIPGSRLGVLTAGTGTARFTRLQVVCGNDSPVTLISAGLTPPLQTPLVFKHLPATLPVATLDAIPEAAELLTLADDPLELEVLP